VPNHDALVYRTYRRVFGFTLGRLYFPAVQRASYEKQNSRSDLWPTGAVFCFLEICPHMYDKTIRPRLPSR
jgi:hypothetical protein